MVTTERKASLDTSLSHYATLADEERVTRTAVALEENGIGVLRATDGGQARRIVLDLIPEGAQVHHGASVSLEASGIVGEIESSGRYDPLKPRIWSMDRETEARRDPAPRRGPGRDARQRPRRHRGEERSSPRRRVAASWALTPRVPGR